jgi:hypothetical protein
LGVLVTLSDLSWLWIVGVPVCAVNPIMAPTVYARGIREGGLPGSCLVDPLDQAGEVVERVLLQGVEQGAVAQEAIGGPATAPESPVP